MSIRQHNVSVASSWRGLLLWYHNVTTLRLTHSRPQECPHSPYLSLLGETFFSPFSFGFALFLYVFLTLFLSVLGMCKHRLSSRPLSRVHAHWEGGRRPRHCAHRHDNLSLTHRPMQTMGAMHVAKWESAGGGGVVRHPRSLHTHEISHMTTYTRLCCHDSRFSLIWVRGLSNAETVH